MSSGFLFLLHAVGRPKEGHQVVNLGMGYRDSSYRQNGVISSIGRALVCGAEGNGIEAHIAPKKVR